MSGVGRPGDQRQWLVLERLRRNCDAGHHETITEVARALEMLPGQTLVAMKALERAGRVEVKGAAPNGGRTWGVTASEEARVL